MRNHARLGLSALLVLGLGALAASWLVRPLVPRAFAVSDADGDGLSTSVVCSQIVAGRDLT